MKISELMQAMSDAGAPMEAILIAVRAIEEREAQIAARDEALDGKKAKDAARKRAEREAARLASDNVHGQSMDNPRTVQGLSTDGPGIVQDEPSLPLLPNENNSNPTTPTHPEKHTPRTRKAHRLPADWVPGQLSDELDAAVSGWPPGALERELARFRDWAASAPASSGCKSDWDATWRNWLRRADDEGRYRNGTNRNAGRSTSHRDAGRPKDGAIDYLDRKHGFDGRPPSPERRDASEGGGDRQRALTGPRNMW